MKSCPWCPDFVPQRGRSDKMCVDCFLRLHPCPPKFVVQLHTPAVFLGDHHHWQTEERHATRFETREDADTAMTALGFRAADYHVEPAQYHGKDVV